MEKKTILTLEQVKEIEKLIRPHFIFMTKKESAKMPAL